MSSRQLGPVRIELELIISVVKSSIDYCNALVCGKQHTTVTDKIQRDQNTSSARDTRLQ